MARARSQSPQVENAIEPTAIRLQPAPNARKDKRSESALEGMIGAESAHAATGPTRRAAGAPGVPDSAPSDTTSVPDSVRDRFLQIREKWYFENGDVAFHDMGSKLSTKSENQEIIRGFVAIARARGWEEINVVDGTKAFRRAIWHEASFQGVPVRGYTPTELDEARLVQAMARRRDAEREVQSPLPTSPDSPNPRTFRGRDRDRDRHRQSDGDREPKSPVQTPKRVMYGTLLAHGAENFQFNPNEDMSYFVKLRTDRGGERVLWGTDLERAFRESKSQPKVGDRVGISHAGQEPVTVPKKERDNSGRVLREYELKTHRNEWVIETEAFFRERAELAEVVRDRSVDARRAVNLNPALAGTYVALRGAEDYAKRHFADAHEQNRFVEAIRHSLARDIKRGAPLYTPALRDREAQRTAARTPGAPEMSPLR